jgi:hypothetical protein
VEKIIVRGGVIVDKERKVELLLQYLELLSDLGHMDVDETVDKVVAQINELLL